MICNECLEPTKKWHWYNNQKVCPQCHHNLQPLPRKLSNVEDIPPTFKNLKKVLEKKY